MHYTAKDLQHLKNLIEARTEQTADGVKPKKGFKENVELLQRLVAEIEDQGHSKI